MHAQPNKDTAVPLRRATGASRSIVKRWMAAALLLAGMCVAGTASALITGTWTLNGAISASTAVNGITVNQAGNPGIGSYANGTFLPGTYWTDPYGGTVASGNGLAVNPGGSTPLTYTITFSKPVDNPVLHVNRIGGFIGSTGGATSTSSSFELTGSAAQSGAVTLTRLSGNAPFVVSGNTFFRPAGVVVPAASNGDCSAATTSTGCGSVQFNGTGITSLTFTVTMIGTPGSTGDGLTLRWSFAGSNVVVRKQSIGAVGTFAFTGTNGVGSFSLDTTLSNPATSATSFPVTNHANPITITESTLPANFTLASAACVDQNATVVASTVDLTTRQLAIAAASYAANQTLTCTFTNSTALSISGTVFQDTLGELLADGTMGSAANPALAGRTVRLFDSAGAQVTTATTAANGSYSFNVAAAGNYYVAVDAPTVNAAGNSTNILLEQTYAAAGAGNSGTAGGTTGYGPLCVGPQPGYTPQAASTTTNTASTTSNGACYGGRRGAVADSGTTTINDKEHVTRVVVGAGNVTGVDFGFSPYVATNVEASGQGSLVQFSRNYANANAGGTYSLRVVPTVPTNAGGGGGNWWNVDIPTLDVSSNTLSLISGRVVHFDGTPRSNTDGTTALDPTPGDMVSATTAVGNQGRTLGSIPRADFVATYTGPGNINGVILRFQSAGAAGGSVRNMGLRSTSVISAMITSIAGQLVVERNVLGYSPDGTAPPTNSATGALFNHVAYNGQILVQNNYIGGFNNGVEMRNQTPGATEGYLIQGNYLTGMASSGVNLQGDRAVVRGNYATLSGMGIHDTTNTVGNTGSNTITENTTTANGRNMHLIRSSETVTFNTITNASGTAPSLGAGVVVETSAGIRISQNTFGGNNSNAIDLNRNGVTIATATGGNCPSSGTANDGLPRPTLTSARLSGTTLTLDGFYCNAGTHTLEFYKAGSAAGDTGSDSLAAGEGVQYLGSLTAQTGGAFTNQTLTTSALVAGDRITAISIRDDGSTSEFSANVALSTAQLTLAKTWANAAINDAVTASLTGTPAPVGGAPLSAVANTPNETDTSPSPYDVAAGQSYTITEAFSVGTAAAYIKALTCIGNTGAGANLSYVANALSGTITLGDTATAVVCTFTNTRTPTVTATKVASASPLVVGQSGQFYTLSITIANGPTTAALTIADTLPTGITLSGAPTLIAGSTSGTLSGCPVSGGNTNGCSVASGVANGTFSIRIPVTVAATAIGASGGNNTANLSGGGDPLCTAANGQACDPTTPTTPVRAMSADLSIVKSNAGTTYTPGTTGSYTLTVRNNGTDAVTGAEINDSLPTGISLNGAISCSVSGGGSCGANTGTPPTITVLLNLSVGAVATITIPVTYASVP